METTDAGQGTARTAAPADGGHDAPLVEVRGLRMRYGTKDVLRGIDLHVRRGEVVALLGPNGAGKTTTIEILEGFRAPSAGEVTVLGVDPRRADDRWRAEVGMVLQSWRDHGKWRVADLLGHFGAFYRPWSRPDRPRPMGTHELLAMVGLGDHGRQRVAMLSGGLRRRLDVAIGLVGRPTLLFLDEPTAGFDPEARRGFHDIVHGLTDLGGTTVLLTTHDLAEAERLADRIVILADGRIAAEGSPDQLSREASTTAEVRWTVDGRRFVHATTDATTYVRDLMAQHGEAIRDLEVRRASLEDAYMALVGRQEAGDDARPADTEGVAA